MFKQFINFMKNAENEKNVNVIETKKSADARESKVRYKNVITFAEELIERSELEINKRERHPIYSLVKMLSDRMVIDNVYELTSVHAANYNSNMSWLNILLDDTVSGEVKVAVMEAIHGKMVTIETTISLAKDAVLTTPWSLKKLRSSLSTIATEKNPWEEKSDNHDVRLWLPMGVIFVTAGNHSIFSGSIKREGELRINAENHKVYDVSKLYEILECDGEFYRSKLDNTIICKVPCFEFACIFGIGELIHLYNKRHPENKIAYLRNKSEEF